MSLSRIFFTVIFGAAVCCSTSCSAVKQTSSKLPKIKIPKVAMKMPKMKAPTVRAPKIPKLTLKKPNFKKFSLTGFGKKKMPIVEVQPGKLKTLKSGEQRALAYNRKRKESSYSSNAPVDYDSATLPAGNGIPTFGLLPAMTEGGSSAMPGSGDLEDLPADDIPSIPLDLGIPEDFGVPQEIPDPTPTSLEAPPTE